MGIFISELWRIRGELLLRESARNTEPAEQFLRIASRIAGEQGAKIFHLRAATSLARLLAENGRREDAQIVLAQVEMNGLDEWSGPEIAIAKQLRSALG